MANLWKKKKRTRLNRCPLISSKRLLDDGETPSRSTGKGDLPLVRTPHRVYLEVFTYV